MGYRFHGDPHVLDALFSERKIEKSRAKRRRKKATVLRRGTMVEKEWNRIKSLLALNYEGTDVGVHFSPLHPTCLLIVGCHLPKELSYEVFGLGGDFENLRGKELTRLPFNPSDFFWIQTKIND